VTATDPPAPDVAAEVAARLRPTHLDYLRARGLTDATIYHSHVHSESNAANLNRILNRSDAAKLGDCLKIPFLDLAGKPNCFARVRLGTPLTDKDGDPIKFLSPVGGTNQPYIPAGVGPALPDPTIPLILTEGEVKALAATQAGFPAIGLIGVYGGQKARPKGPDGRKTGPRELIPGLAAVAWKGRKVFISFDSDAVTNRNVKLAEYHLAAMLQAAGADVRIVRLPAEPDGGKNGLDDYLVRYGADDFRRLVEGAQPVGPPPKKIKPVHAVDDPKRLATEFLAVLKRGTFWFWRDEFIRYKDGGYATRPESEVRAVFTKYIEAEFVKAFEQEVEAYRAGATEKAPECVRKCGTRTTADAIQSLKAAALLSSTTTAPAWINGGTGPDPLTLLPVRNGILDLGRAAAGKSDALIPATPKFLTFNPTSFAYDPQAPDPVRWLAFLQQLWPDDPKTTEALQEWFGYLLTPDSRQQKILFLLGPRRSGKGTIARVIRELIGPGNVAGPTLNSLAQNFGLAPLLDKSAAIIDDARLSSKTDTAVIVERLLTISGEGVLDVDRKHREQVTGKLNTRIVILSNELPRFNDPSGALIGRIIVLRFTKSWYGKEDHGLFDALRAELPGILRWAVAGWKRLRDRGHFVQPPDGAELLRHLEDSASPIGEFLREQCVIDVGASVDVGALMSAWRSWCEGRGWEKKQIGTEQSFGRYLRAAVPCLAVRRPKKDKVRWREYVGVRLRTPDDADPDDPVEYANPTSGSAEGSAKGPQKNGDFTPEGPGGSAGSANSTTNACGEGETDNSSYVRDAMGGTADPRTQDSGPVEFTNRDWGGRMTPHRPTTVADLLVALERANGWPIATPGKLTFPVPPPRELLPLIRVLHSGVRAILTRRPWFGLSGETGWADRLNPETPIPLWVEYLAAQGDTGWDRIRPASRTELPYLFVDVPEPKPSGRLPRPK
jgi:putative DNA primase/helicase